MISFNGFEIDYDFTARSWLSGPSWLTHSSVQWSKIFRERNLKNDKRLDHFISVATRPSPMVHRAWKSECENWKFWNQPFRRWKSHFSHPEEVWLLSSLIALLSCKENSKPPWNHYKQRYFYFHFSKALDFMRFSVQTTAKASMTHIY